jgi:hypothetical protein
VDFKELLIYKFLEYTGVGPEAHFFFGELVEECYIATIDASIDITT